MGTNKGQGGGGQGGNWRRPECQEATGQWQRPRPLPLGTRLTASPSPNPRPGAEEETPCVLSQGGSSLDTRSHVPSSTTGISYDVVALEKPQKYLGEEKALAMSIVLPHSAIYNNERRQCT